VGCLRPDLGRGRRRGLRPQARGAARRAELVVWLEPNVARYKLRSACSSGTSCRSPATARSPRRPSGRARGARLPFARGVKAWPIVRRRAAPSDRGSDEAMQPAARRAALSLGRVPPTRRPLAAGTRPTATRAGRPSRKARRALA
jgi:hypothetical protein